jgi:hypothetical protein
MQVRYRAALRPEKENSRGCEGKEKIHFGRKKWVWHDFLSFNF